MIYIIQLKILVQCVIANIMYAQVSIGSDTLRIYVSLVTGPAQKVCSTPNMRVFLFKNRWKK